MKKILYVDIPFLDIQTEAASRSVFLWDTISKNFEADLLLLKTPLYLTRPLHNPSGYNQVYGLVTMQGNPLKSRSVYQFSRENLDKFSQIIKSKHYDAIFFRLTSCIELINIAEEIIPECNLIIDVDTLFSRQAELAWQSNPKWKNAAVRLELYKLKQLENSLFMKQHDFLFSTGKDKKTALACANAQPDNPRFILLNNSIRIDSSQDDSAIPTNDKFIIFFGNLGSTVNLDAFSYLCREIYPRISKKLQEKDVKIYIAGDGQQKMHEQLAGGRIKLIGSVQNLPAYIKASLFAIFPFRMPVDALPQILEAAGQKKTVIITSMGIENAEFSNQEIIVEDRIDEFCNQINQLLASPGKANDMGQNLHQVVAEQYNKDTASHVLINLISSKSAIGTPNTVRKGIRLAIIANNYSHSNKKFDSPINQQIRKLAEIYQVTVLSSRRISQAATEDNDGIRIYRFLCLLNHPEASTDYPANAFCPQILWHLLRNDYDIILCLRNLNFSNYLAFVAAKIKAIPVVFSSLGLLNYAEMFQTEDLSKTSFMQDLELKWHEKLFLKNLDYVFTVSEKEYGFLRKQNGRCELIPLAIGNPHEEQDIMPTVVTPVAEDDSFIIN